MKISGSAESWIDRNSEKPIVNTTVDVLLEDGSETLGFFFDNYQRSGWKTKGLDGLYWLNGYGGSNVTHWRYTVLDKE